MDAKDSLGLATSLEWILRTYVAHNVNFFKWLGKSLSPIVGWCLGRRYIAYMGRCFVWVSDAPRVWLHLVGHLSLAMRSISIMQFRQLLLVGQLHLDGSSESAAQGLDLTCKCGSVGQSEGLLIPRSSVRFRLTPENSNSNGFELHRPSIKGTKLLFKVIKAIIIIITRCKTAIFPGTREGNVHDSNESTRGGSLREADV